MQTLALILAFAVTVAAPYTLVMAMPRLWHAIAAALAIAVPIALAFRHTGLPAIDPRRWSDVLDAELLAVLLISLAVAVFVRAVTAAIGERARAPGARIAINVLGLAIVGGTLPWLGELLAMLGQP